MAITLPGYKVWENTTPLTTAASPLVSPWIETTGFTTLLVAYVFTTGTTAITVEGSFDGSTQDTTMPYSAVGTSPASVTVMHTYVRIRVVQTVSNATVTTVFAQSKA